MRDDAKKVDPLTIDYGMHDFDLAMFSRHVLEIWLDFRAWFSRWAHNWRRLVFDRSCLVPA
jgi:hypothetical protein